MGIPQAPNTANIRQTRPAARNKLVIQSLVERSSGTGRESGDLAQADELCHRSRFGLLHHLPSMLLHGRFADRESISDLLVEPARNDLAQHVALARRESRQ